MKLIPQLLLPLIAQMWWAQHTKAPSVSAGQQLGWDQSSFDRLTNPNVIGNQHPDDI